MVVAIIIATVVGNGCWQQLLATMVGAGGSGIAGEATGAAAGWPRAEWGALGVRGKRL